MTQWIPRVALILLAGCDSPPAAVPDAAPPPAASRKAPRTLTRLFVQDLATTTLKWADLRGDEEGHFYLDPPAAVPGFPALDAAKQKLVQIQQAGGLVVVGVRDDAGGAAQSGWVLVDSGVTREDHGDHADYSFQRHPAVADSRLDAKQGNPAHVYQYGGQFYIANDKLNGVTRIDPADYHDAHKGTPRFIAAGGGHITLAVAGGKVAYGTWIDGGGPNQGRVDVAPVTGNSKGYRFKLPGGGLHGATANSGKVFFAPAEGVCWVAADPELKLKPDQVQVHTISLGNEGDKPLRTGAFADLGHHVVFTAGKEKPRLVILDASQAAPKPVTVPLAAVKGTQAVTPKVVTTPGGKPLALVFHDRVADTDTQEMLEIVDLDPDGDGDFADAKSLKTIGVGKSLGDGHSGHHDLAFDAENRVGVFTNPGDGALAVLSLETLEVVATLPVGGKPAALVACGARGEDD